MEILKGAAWRARALTKRVRKKTSKYLPIALRRGETLYRRAARALGNPEPPTANHVVVSLTSFPLRIGKLHHVISSLLDQSVQPSKIVLYLSFGDFPRQSLPRSLSRLEGERFEIRFASENLRSYNKLLFAVADFPGKWIATADDDRLYPVNWLECLLKSASENPGTVICTCGRRMVVTDGRLLPYRDWPTDESQRRSFLLFPVGSWGILYPPGLIDPARGHRDLIRKLAWLNDDVWFKAMSLIQNVPCRAWGAEHSAHSIDFKPNIRLWDLNRGGSLTDEALNKVFGYFGLTPDVILAKETVLISSKPIVSASTEAVGSPS